MKRNAERLEDRLGENEPPYKSRGEAQVGRLLDRSEIPFFYEQPTRIHDRGRYRIWRPDFTLPAHGGLIIEYAGMPDVPDYAAGIRHKQRAYRANHLPALFIYPQDITGPNWPQRVIGRIHGVTGNAQDRTIYRDPGGRTVSARGPRYGR